MDYENLTDEELLRLAERGIKTPVQGMITSVYDDTREAGRGHASGDIAAKPGTPVVAPGNIEFVAGKQGGKNLRDNDWWAHFKDVDTGLEYRFAHIDDISHLKPGEVVPKGTEFTKIGSAIKGPHLHMKVLSPTGEPIDWVSKSGLKKNSSIVGDILGTIDDWLGPKQAHAQNFEGMSDEELLKIANGEKTTLKTTSNNINYDNLSDEELLQLANKENKAPTNYDKMSDEELLQLANGTQPQVDAWKNVKPETLALVKYLGETANQEDKNLSNLIAGPAGETNLPAAGVEALTAFDKLFWPLHKGKEFLQSQLEKVPSFKSPILGPTFSGEAAEVNVGEHRPEMVYPSISEAAPEIAELAALPAYTKLLGKTLPVGKLLEAAAPRGYAVVGETTSPMANLADVGAIESRVMASLGKLRQEKPNVPFFSSTLGKELQEPIGVGETLAPEVIETLSTPYKKASEELRQKISELPSESLAPLLTDTPPTTFFEDKLKSALFSEGRIGPLSKEAVKNILKSSGVATIGAAVVNAISPDQAQAGVPPALVNALSELTNVAKGSTGKVLIENVAKVAADYGVDSAQLMNTFKRLEKSGGLEAFLQSPEAFGSISQANMLGGRYTAPKQPGIPTNPVPPVTEAPNSVRKFAEEMAGVRVSYKNKTEIPDNLDVPNIDPVVPALKQDMNRLDLERSPNIVSSNYFTPENNLVGDYHQSILNFQNNTPTVSRILSNVFKEAGLKNDIVASKKAVEEQVGPLFSEWRNVVEPEVSLMSKIKTEQSYLSRFDKNSPEYASTVDKITQMEAELGLLKVQNAPLIQDIYKKRQILLEELGTKYANVRIKSAAEGEAWAQALIQPHEQKVVDQMRKYLDITASRMTAQGMRTLQQPNKDYVPYIFQTGQYGDTGGIPFAERLWYGTRDKPSNDWLDFISRTPGSKDWFPLAYQSMESYVPSVERKIAFNGFLRKWTPAINEWRATNFKNTAEWASSFINRNMGIENTNILSQGINTLTNLEYLHYLAGSVSTAFLHLFKLLQTPMWHGFVPTIKAAGSMMKALVPNTVEANLYRNYVQARSLTRALTQAPGMETFMSERWWKTFLNKATNNPIVNPTRLIEAFDNGMNMFATIHSGLGAGAKTNTINRAVLESMMLLNFRGFATPRALTSSVGRLVGMFQTTPFKLTENKIDLIKKALTGSKDIYGRNDFNKLVRWITLTGLVIGTGKAAGVDLLKHAGLHVPFLSETPKGETTLAVTPIAKYAVTAAKEGPKAGLKEALSYWGPTQKLAEDFIPQKYSGSKMQQVFGMPSVGWKERAQAEQALKEVKSLKGKIKREVKKPGGKVETPYDFLTGLLGD